MERVGLEGWSFTIKLYPRHLLFEFTGYYSLSARFFLSVFFLILFALHSFKLKKTLPLQFTGLWDNL